MLRVRDLICDNRQREGIAVERVKRPPIAWLRDQEDQRVITLPEEEAWWRVLPLSGGSVLVPESLAIRLREATYEDVMKAIDEGNEHARRELASIFPDILEAVKRQRSNPNG